MQRRQRIALLLQLLLVLATGLLGIVTNYATGEGPAPLPLRVLERLSIPLLVLLLVALLVGHFVAYRLENPVKPPTTWDPARMPYPGLEAFDEDEAAVFFGREAQAEEVVRRLNDSASDPASRFVTIVGASGSGKSSLAQAGVLPRLRGQRWLVLPSMIPGTDPIGALAKTIASINGEPAEQTVRRLRRNIAELPALLERSRRRAGRRFGRTLLVIDQMEELVTLSGEHDRELFLRGLWEAVRHDRQFRVLATLRVEFLGDLLESAESRLFTQPVAIGALGRDELTEVVEKPADAVGMRFAPGVVARIVADTGSGDALPLLAHLLQELYLRVGSGRTVTMDDYLALGGVAGALSRHADQVVTELRGDEDPAEIMRVLLLFVTVTSTEATRRRVPLNGLSPDERRIVDAFVDARLLVSDVGNGTPVAQVTHEALFRQWAPLRQEVETHTALLRQRAELERWAADWKRSGHSPDYLLTGNRLTVAQRWLEGLRETGQDLPELVEFVDASRRRDLEFLRRVSNSVGEYVLANAEKYPELSILLCLSALTECVPTPVTQRALMAALAFSHGRAVLSGHTDTVRNLAWSPDGTRIATASRDGTARIWDAATGSPLRELTGHLGMVEMVAWSPDSTRIATASRDRTVRIWDADTGRCVLTLNQATDVVRGVAWSPDGQRVAGSSRDRVVRVWEADTGRLAVELRGHEDNVLGAVWSPDSSRLATASHDRAVIVWHVDEARPSAVLRGHQDFVEGVSWSPDGTRIATGSGDHTIRIWDVESGRQELLIRGHRDRVWNVAWSPDGTALASASADGTARVFSPVNAEETAVLRGHSDYVWGVVWSPDGKQLATASEDGTARIWDLVPHGAEERLLPMTGGCVRTVACSPAGRIAAASDDGTVRVWDPADDRPVAVLRAHSSTPRDLAWSPDSRRILSGSTDRTALLWSCDTPASKNRIDHDGAIVESVAWSPDGSRVATGGQDRTIRVWDAEDVSPLAVLAGHQDWVVALAWSPSGRFIASTSDDRTARVWELANGRERAVLHGHENWVDAVSWSPDESRIVTSSADWTARIWNLADGRTLHVLKGHEGRVPSVAWSPDGSRIATASYDRTVRIWDAATGEETAVVGVHRDRVTSVAWLPDGSGVVSGSFDGTVRVWRAEVDWPRVQERARARVFRALTEEERRGHLLPVPDGAQ